MTAARKVPPVPERVLWKFSNPSPWKNTFTSSCSRTGTRPSLAKSGSFTQRTTTRRQRPEYPTDVGEIDLLARHRKQPRWLVVELKRGQTSDNTVGQILRYIGWIRRHLAKPKESVEGLIIARSVDDNLRYAASVVPLVKLMEYDVSFHLHAAKPLDVIPKKDNP